MEINQKSLNPNLTNKPINIDPNLHTHIINKHGQAKDRQNYRPWLRQQRVESVKCMIAYKKLCTLKYKIYEYY